MHSRFPRLFPLLAALAAAPAFAQSTCYTNALGTTICSTPQGVIHGNTNSSGYSVYRDEHGNRLDLQTTPTGDATLQTTTGQTLRWSQPVLGELKYPDTGSAPRPSLPHPAVATEPPPLDFWLHRLHPKEAPGNRAP